MRRVLLILALAAGIAACSNEPGEQALSRSEKLEAAGKRAEALAALEESAAAGNKTAATRLGAHYSNLRSPHRNRQKAEYWLQRCADAHEAQCHELLGILFLSDWEKPMDLARAKQHLERAKSLGLESAGRVIQDLERGIFPVTST